MTKKNFAGQSLIEILVIMGVTSLVLTSLVSAVVVGVRNSRFAKNQSLATKIAQEAMEKVRRERDQQSSWSDFDEATCENPSGLDDPPPPFTRSIDCTLEEGNTRMKVFVMVSWPEGAKIYQSQLTTYLTQWQ